MTVTATATGSIASIVILTPIVIYITIHIYIQMRPTTTTITTIVTITITSTIISAIGKPSGFHKCMVVVIDLSVSQTMPSIEWPIVQLLGECPFKYSLQ